MTEKITFSVFERITDRPRRISGTFEQIVGLVTRAPALAPGVPPPPAPLPEGSPPELAEAYERHVKDLKNTARTIKNQAPLFSPAIFDEGPTSSLRATADNVEEIGFVVIDIDGADDATIKRVKASLSVYDAAGSSTFSHRLWTKEGANCFRFVVRPTRSLSPAEWPTLWEAVQRFVVEGANDVACRNPDRKFFLSRVPDYAAALFETWRSDSREPLDVDALLQRAAREGITTATVAKKPATPKNDAPVEASTTLSIEQREAVVKLVRDAYPGEGTGKRHEARLALAGTLRNSGLSEDEADAIVLDCDVSGDDADCRAAVASTFSKAPDDAYTSSTTLATLLGDHAADGVEVILRRAATSKINQVIDSAVGSGPAALCAPSAIRALVELQDRDPGAFVAKLAEITQTYRIKTELNALIKDARKKRDASKRNDDSEFVEGADGRPIGSVRNVAVALRMQTQKVGAQAGQPRYRLDLLRSEIVDFGTNGLGPKGTGPLPVDDARAIEIGIELDCEHGLRIDKSLVWDGLITVAANASFDPIRDYLRGLKPWDGHERIAHIARAISDDKLAPLLLKRWLVAAVARGLEPGCKQDTMLVLRGHEGLFKSALFDTLAGEFFSDTDVDPFDKDGKSEAARTWVHEWSDLGAVKGKDGDRLKAFLSSRFDRFRPAYARTSVNQPRRACFCGTTNRDRFLIDNEGDRRVWIIPVVREVPVEIIRKARDLLWAEAVATYDAFQQDIANGIAKNDSPHKWWLTRDEDLKREAINAEHRAENPWTDRLREQACNFPDAFTLHDLASRFLNMSTLEVDRVQTRIGQALKSLGFRRDGRKWVGGDDCRRESALLLASSSNEHSSAGPGRLAH